MFQATDKAVEMLKDYLKQKSLDSRVRVLLAEGGWSGPKLGLALDESKESDHVFDRDGLAFVIDKKLLEDVQPVTVDYVATPSGEGFTIDSSLTNADACGSCSSC